MTNRRHQALSVRQKVVQNLPAYAAAWTCHSRMRPVARRFHLCRWSGSHHPPHVGHRRILVRLRISNSGVSALRVFAAGARDSVIHGSSPALNVCKRTMMVRIAGGCGAPARHLRLRIIFRSSLWSTRGCAHGRFSGPALQSEQLRTNIRRRINTRVLTDFRTHQRRGCFIGVGIEHMVGNMRYYIRAQQVIRN